MTKSKNPATTLVAFSPATTRRSSETVQASGTMLIPLPPWTRVTVNIGLPSGVGASVCRRSCSSCKAITSSAAPTIALWPRYGWDECAALPCTVKASRTTPLWP